MGRTEKEAFIEKMISDTRLRKDLLDIALIEEAKKVKGKSISAKEYFLRRRKTGSNQQAPGEKPCIGLTR